MKKTLTPEFYKKLNSICSGIINPEDLLLVMTLESGLDPEAMNPNGKAVGMIQFMPFVLPNVGFKGSPEEFGQLEAVSQLDYISNYLKQMTSWNGGPFKSASQYYVANFYPAALTLPGIRANDPNAIIVEKDQSVKRYKGTSPQQDARAYAANPGLDANKDGKITLGDLQNVLDRNRSNPKYINAIEQLHKYVGFSNEKVENTNRVEKTTPDDLEKILQDFSDALAVLR